MRPLAAPAVVAGLSVVLAACSSTVDTPPRGRTGAATSSTPTPTVTTPAASPGHTHGSGPVTRTTTPAKAALRKGERFVTLRMPAPYTPRAPAAPGTDDYRCFLLDPGTTQRSVVTGIDVLPGNPAIVHHVILFTVPPSAVAAAQEEDRRQAGQGWTCFGGTGVQGQLAGPQSAPWLGAWAPGGGEQVLAPDVGMPLDAGSRIIMQVHYNLLAGTARDQSAARLRIARDDGSRSTLHTVLLPAPVEVPCRAGRTGPLCDRAAAVADVRQRFGRVAGQVADGLHLLCPGNQAGPTQSCTREVTRAQTIRAVAGHMHLLGRKISVTVNRGRPDERTVLDIPVWDFDNQGSRPVARGLKVGPGDTLTVSCTHDQALRDQLPAFAGQPERYVVWGEGSTDEMCLGVVLVTRP